MKICHLLRTLPICLVLLALVQQTRAQNYNLLGATAGLQARSVVMKLGLGPTTVALQDGSSSWNASAADALDIWNGYVDFITLSSIASATVPEISGDGVNATFFSSTIFGDTFGDDTLAVRGKLETGDNVMIGGFIVGGDDPTPVLVRAIGPSSIVRQSRCDRLIKTVLELRYEQ